MTRGRTARLLVVFLAAACAVPASDASVPAPVQAAAPSTVERIFDLGEVATPPVATSQAKPAYPKDLREKRVSGEAVVAFVINRLGAVEDAEVVSATRTEFGESALAAIREWRFRPGLVGGRPVRVRLRVPIVFDLSPPKDGGGAAVAELSGPVFETGEVDVQPQVVQRYPPEYPEVLRRSGRTGDARLEFIVTASGAVVEVRVLKASHPFFGDAARAAMARWRFKPGEKDGRPVNVRLQMPMGFTLPN